MYEDEYEALMDYLKNNGYKRAEFFYACIHSAKKNSMDAVYKQITEDHRKRRAEEREFMRAMMQ